MMSDICSCSIIEKDLNDDILWTWTYPSISQKQRDLSLSKCTFDGPNFLYGRCYRSWFYINVIDVSESSTLPNVKQFASVLWTKDFNPEKYEKLCHLINKSYLDSGNPTTVLQLYLSVITKGVCPAKENGTLFIKELAASSQTQKSMVKDLISLFGLETILIYTVLLLKKRLIVYHHSLPVLLKWMPSFLLLMQHRNGFENLFPWLDINTDDLEQLKEGTSYVAGFCDNSVLSRTDLYDVLVNLPAQEISIAPHAKDNLAMTKVHKDIALFMVQLSESEMEEKQVVKAIADKTQELLAQIRSLGKVMDDSRCLVSIETIREKKVSHAMENFLFQLALAENMLML